MDCWPISRFLSSSAQRGSEKISPTLKGTASGNCMPSVLCLNDLMAYGAIQAISDKGKSVPGDISVVGMDDIYISTKFSPSLTSIGFNKLEYGKLAFDVLHRHIRHNTVDDVTVSTELFIRDSTGPVHR